MSILMELLLLVTFIVTLAFDAREVMSITESMNATSSSTKENRDAPNLGHHLQLKDYFEAQMVGCWHGKQRVEDCQEPIPLLDSPFKLLNTTKHLNVESLVNSIL